MSLSDIDLASLIDIYSRDDCVAVFRSQVAECLRELQSLRASQAKVVEALRNLLDASDDSDSAYREELLDAARSRAKAVLAEHPGGQT